MITIQDFMTVTGYRITETSDYMWQCYGNNAVSMDSWNGINGAGGYNIGIVFDRKDQTVYEMTACDYTNNRAYRWFHPSFNKEQSAEVSFRNVDDNAWDDVPFIDLDVTEDMLQKANAIVAGEDYDTRVMTAIEFSDEDLFSYMKLAHEQDITFNQLVENALQAMIAKSNTSSHYDIF